MNLICGIDPGTKTGWSLYDPFFKKLVRVETTTIIRAIEEITHLVKTGVVVKIVFEDARLRKWFGKRGDFNHQGVGSVKRDCNIWQEFCEYYNIKFEAVHPKNNRTKIKSDQFKKITGWRKRTSEHSRDAAMLVFGSK